MSIADEDGWRVVRHAPCPARSKTIVLLDDDDDVQICSPRSFAKAKSQARDAEDELELSLGPPKSRKRASSNVSKHRRKRVLPAVAVDLTTANEPTVANDDCQVVTEKPKTRKESRDIKLTCAICFDTMKEETSTVCGHLFCAACIHSAIQAQKKCPACRRKLTNSMVHRIYLA